MHEPQAWRLHLALAFSCDIILPLCVYTQSVIMTVHNAAEWIEDALRSILAQTFQGKLELSLFDDASTVSHAPQ